jgi:hypothetical protein
MSNDAKKYSISSNDIVKLIMEKHDIHEGFYILLPELSINVGSHSIPSETESNSESHVGITMITTGYSLIEVTDNLNTSWDASAINPIADESTEKK